MTFSMVSEAESKLRLALRMEQHRRGWCWPVPEVPTELLQVAIDHFGCADKIAYDGLTFQQAHNVAFLETVMQSMPPIPAKA